MSREVYAQTTDGTYYIEKKFAWIPVYVNGTFVWFGSYWITYLDRGKGMEYKAGFPYDPRTKP